MNRASSSLMELTCLQGNWSGSESTAVHRDAIVPLSRNCTHMGETIGLSIFGNLRRDARIVGPLFAGTTSMIGSAVSYNTPPT